MKNSDCSTACLALNWLVTLFLFLATLASLAGVYKAHFFGQGAVFGTSNTSLSLLAFVVSLSLWSKWMCTCLCGDK